MMVPGRGYELTVVYPFLLRLHALCAGISPLGIARRISLRLLDGFVEESGMAPLSVGPIKRDVKRKTLLPAGVPEIFSDIQPPTTLPTPLCWQLLDRIGLSRSGLTSRGASGLRALFSRWHHVRCHDGAVRFSETHKLNLVAELPTIVLLETRGLQLSSVVRGGIG
jgi:hypothetical protein